MFCPECSQKQASEQEHFCKRCGFNLHAVKEAIEEAALSGKSARLGRGLPEQKDISIGAALMFIGGVVALLWGYLNPVRDADLYPQIFLVMGFTLGFILLLFPPLLFNLRSRFSESKEKPEQVANQRNGISLGAILMFLGILKSWTLTTFVSTASRRPPLILALMAVMLLLIFLVRPAMKVVSKLFFGNEAPPETNADKLVSSDVTRALPAAHSIPAQTLISPDRQAANMMPAPSVTENTTDLLKK